MSWMRIENKKNEAKKTKGKKTHNFQFHRKEINVYRRIDCGTAKQHREEKKRTETENGFQHAIARFDRPM